MAFGVFKVLCLLLGCVVAGDLLPSTTSESTAEDCGDVQHNVETGMIRLPDLSGESIKDLNCSWTYTAPPGRKLLVKVDSVHLPPLDVRSSVFKLYIDDQMFDIPRNCAKCLREMVGGKVVKVIFESYLVSSVESTSQEVNQSVSSAVEGIGSFQVRYKAFDPDRCSKPETVENGLIIGKGRKVGQTILYHCNSPYDLVGEAKVTCIVPESTPVPNWSSGAPKCVISECDDGPILRDAGSGSIASPGYPTYIYNFTTSCHWEITAELHQQVKVNITYLKITRQTDHFGENSTVLSLLDGNYSNSIVNLTESLVIGTLNFSSLTNKLIIRFSVYKGHNGGDETGFFMNYVAIPSSCPDPETPENGEVIAHSQDLGSVIAYRCNPGFVLVGELHAECLLNGKWSHPTPRCELLTVHTEHLLAASNDSDTVTAKLTELSSITSASRGSSISLASIGSSVSEPSSASASSGSSAFAPSSASSGSSASPGSSASAPSSASSGSSASSASEPSSASLGSSASAPSSVSPTSFVSSKASPASSASPDSSTSLKSSPTYSAASPASPASSAAPIFSASSVSSKAAPASAASPASPASPSFPAFPSSSASSASPAKTLRGGKKKATERMSTKSSPTKPPIDEKENFPVQQEEIPFDAFLFPAQTPNSTTVKKVDKESGPKSEPHLQQVVPPKEAGKKIIDYPPVMTSVSRGGWGSENVTFLPEKLPPTENDYDNIKDSTQRPAMSMTMILIIAGVGAPLTVGIVLLIIVLVYRRRYPVRMRFGRKFSTFENPMYVSKDAHHPRELKRLTK